MPCSYYQSLLSKAARCNSLNVSICRNRQPQMLLLPSSTSLTKCLNFYDASHKFVVCEMSDELHSSSLQTFNKISTFTHLSSLNSTSAVSRFVTLHYTLHQQCGNSFIITTFHRELFPSYFLRKSSSSASDNFFCSISYFLYCGNYLT